MQIAGNRIETGTSPKEWFMGAAYATCGPHGPHEEYGAAPSIEEA